MRAALTSSELSRRQFFFSVGMVVLPPFWAWWTLQRSFTVRVRALAFLWANVYLLLLFLAWDKAGDHIVAAVVGYDYVCRMLSWALAIWLYLRVTRSVIPLLILVDIIAIQAGVMPAKSFAWWVPFVLPLLLVLAHCKLDSLGEELRGWERR